MTRIPVDEGAGAPVDEEAPLPGVVPPGEAADDGAGVTKPAMSARPGELPSAPTLAAALQFPVVVWALVALVGALVALISDLAVPPPGERTGTTLAWAIAWGCGYTIPRGLLLMAIYNFAVDMSVSSMVWRGLIVSTALLGTLPEIVFDVEDESDHAQALRAAGHCVFVFSTFVLPLLLTSDKADRFSGRSGRAWLQETVWMKSAHVLMCLVYPAMLVARVYEPGHTDPLYAALTLVTVAVYSVVLIKDPALPLSRWYLAAAAAWASFLPSAIGHISIRMVTEVDSKADLLLVLVVFSSLVAVIHELALQFGCRAVPGGFVSLVMAPVFLYEDLIIEFVIASSDPLSDGTGIFLLLLLINSLKSVLRDAGLYGEARRWIANLVRRRLGVPEVEPTRADAVLTARLWIQAVMYELAALAAFLGALLGEAIRDEGGVGQLTGLAADKRRRLAAAYVVGAAATLLVAVVSRRIVRARLFRFGIRSFSFRAEAIVIVRRASLLTLAAAFFVLCNTLYFVRLQRVEDMTA